MKLIPGALVVVVAMTACTTPAPEPTTSSAPTTTSHFVDEQSLQGRYNRFVAALNSKNDDAMFLCGLPAFTFAQTLVQHAVSSTEAQLAQLPAVHRLQVYEMRTSNSPLGVVGDSGALRLLLVSSRDLLRPAELTDERIEEPRASASVTLPGYAPVRVPFARGTSGAWIIDLAALFDALSGALDLKGLTVDQFVDQKYGARAAELRKPLK